MYSFNPKMNNLFAGEIASFFAGLPETMWFLFINFPANKKV